MFATSTKIHNFHVKPLGILKTLLAKTSIALLTFRIRAVVTCHNSAKRPKFCSFFASVAFVLRSMPK